MTPTIPLVAIVEDDPSTLKALTRLVSAYGYAVDGYTSAEAFVRRSTSDNVDCLLLDINLGGESGLKLHSALLEIGDAPPTVFITGNADDSIIDEVLEHQCAGFLTKPVDSALLLSVIQRALVDAPSWISTHPQRL